MKATSFSQNIMFDKCKLSWYLKYIKKVPTVDDFTYANGGTVMHKSLELYYGLKSEFNFDKEQAFKETKMKFEGLWLRYKLDKSFLRNKQELYWDMIVRGIDLDENFTSLEMKIFFSDVVGYLDAVNTQTDEIIDYKSSTRSKTNEIEYSNQLKFYAYLYFRKFNRIPNKCIVYYLKYSGKKGILEIEPTIDDIREMELWHNNIRKEMSKIIEENKYPNRADECFYFCGYKNNCNIESQGFNYTLHLIGNYIQVDGNITPLLAKGINKKFSYELKNAFWMKKRNPYAVTTINFWNQNKRILPIGFLDCITKTLQDYADYKKKSLKLVINDKRVFDKTIVEMPDKFVNGVELRDYQNEAVNKFLEKKIGMLELATGSGKTEIAIECIRKIGFKTLFVVNKIELLKQTKKRVEDSLGIEVGQIGQGINDIKDITIVTIQTLIKDFSKYSNYLQSVRFCIFDETHAASSKSYQRLSNHLINTEYRLGLSATCFRTDGEEMRMSAVVGDILHNLNSKTLIENGWLVKPSIIFIKNYIDKNIVDEIEQNCLTGLINETSNYHNFYKGFISENIIRNNYISNIVGKNRGKKILILTKLVSHGETLNKQLIGSKFIYGNTTKEERNKIFDDFKNNKIKVLVGSIQICGEGLDIPNLDIVINASGNRGDIKTIQVLGRVLRLFEGKINAKYFDFIDEHYFFKTASFARRRKFFQEGHEIDTIEAKNL